MAEACRQTIDDTLATVAHELYRLCSEKRFLEAIERYYSENVESIEPLGDTGSIRRLTGRALIRAQNETWLREHTIHSFAVTGPYLGQNEFGLRFEFDLTHLPSGHRKRLSEFGIYQVQGGLVTGITFFYGAA